MDSFNEPCIKCDDIEEKIKHIITFCIGVLIELWFIHYTIRAALTMATNLTYGLYIRQLNMLPI